MIRTRENAPLVPIGLATGLLYAITYAAQAAISPAQKGALSQNTLLWWSAVFVISTLCLFALFAWVIVLASDGRLQTPKARRVAIGFPVAFALAGPRFMQFCWRVTFRRLLLRLLRPLPSL